MNQPNYTGPIQPNMGGPDNTKQVSKHTLLKILVVVIAVIVLFVGGILAIVFMATSGVTSAADEFIAALSRGEIEEAYESTSMGFQEATSGEDFEVFLNSNPVLEDVESASFSSMGVSDNTFGYAGGTITSKSGQVSPIVIELVNENDEWRVLNIDLTTSSRPFDDYDEDFMDDF